MTADDGPVMLLTITIEGEFVSASHGQISEDRKQLLIPDASVLAGGWEFSIRGLAAK